MPDELEMTGDLSKDNRILAYRIGKLEDKYTSLVRNVKAGFKSIQTTINSSTKSVKDSMVAKVSDLRDSAKDGSKDHENRLRKLEESLTKANVKLRILSWVAATLTAALIGAAVKNFMEMH